MDISDPDGRQESLSRLVDDVTYFDEQLKKVQTDLEAAKAALLQRLDGEEFTAESGAWTVSVSYRGEGRKVDVVKLMKAGFKKEEFSSVRPTISALTKLAESKEWSEVKLDGFILPDTGPKKGYVRVERKPDMEDDE